MSEKDFVYIMAVSSCALVLLAFLVWKLTGVVSRKRHRASPSSARGGVSKHYSDRSRRSRERDHYDADDGMLPTGAALPASGDDHGSLWSSEVTSFGGSGSGGGYSGGGSSGGDSGSGGGD
ncbi:hypothetical protein [Roseibium sp. RKSG952]|uniref:hypothetical protein n=1 Tax=Roseibium sp. RKSG952 TaxID=2529384 RepID=UPI0012BD524B|nr:hypothetical protein [Roseibium sp. RKSG952]MTH95926.1 hypothetical protein [Roseibium sp. RKSG952]